MRPGAQVEGKSIFAKVRVARHVGSAMTSVDHHILASTGLAHCGFVHRGFAHGRALGRRVRASRIAPGCAHGGGQIEEAMVPFVIGVRASRIAAWDVVLLRDWAGRC